MPAALRVALALSLALYFTQPASAQPKAPPKVRVLLLGDSTVIGSICRRQAPKADHLEDVIRKLLAAEKDLPPAEVLNQGRDGEHIHGLLSGRYGKDIAKLPRVDFVLIRYGLNDNRRRDDFAVNFPKDYRELLRRLREDHPGCQIVVETTIPYLGEETDKKINDLVRAVAAAEKLPLLDTHARYAAELKHGLNVLNYRRVKLDKVPAQYHALLPPDAVKGGELVMLDNTLDAHLRGVPGWFNDRHPNLAGYHVIGDEAARFLAPLIRARHKTSAPAKEARQDGAAGWKTLFDGKSLEGWKATDFYKAGKVAVKDGAVVMEKGERMTGVTYARKDFPKMDYEVTLEGKKLAGTDFFCTTTFPVGNSICSLVVGGWGGRTVGISSINGADASENETNRDIEFKQGQWYRVRVRVTAQRIQAWIGQEKVVDLETDGRQLSTRIECVPCQPFGIATWDTVGAVRDVRVRSLTEAEKKGSAGKATRKE
jgi:lysophospholipase L1-like esterase